MTTPEPTRAFRLEIDGVGEFDEWTSAEVGVDLKDLSWTFSFYLRDDTRSAATFVYSSEDKLYRVRQGAKVKIFINDTHVLTGKIKTASPHINDDFAEITISGEDKTGDLIDSAAVPEGPSEFKNMKLEDFAARITEPFNIPVRTDIDTGDLFRRLDVDLPETALSAIEGAARKRYALLTSDGTTGLLITRTGASKAPADIKLPGNVLDASASFTEKGRHSETIVIGQAEALDGDRKGRKASQSPSQGAKRPEDRQATDGSATTRERRGTAITRRIRDEEVKDHRPKVHLAKGLTTAQATQDEADWRQRTARGEAEDTTYQVRGFDVNGSLWHANQIVGVDDAFLGIKRDMVISAINYSYKEETETTSLTVSSPESFDNQPTGSRRSNTSTSKKGGASTGLDGLANRL